MLELNECSPLEMLRQFAVELDADLKEDLGAAKIELNNGFGRGTISLYEVFPGLTAWVYNIMFDQDFTIDLKFSKNKSYYFGYHVSGCQKTKFDNEIEYKKISQGQNFILASSPDTKAQFIIPAKTKYECCYLIIEPGLLHQNPHSTAKRLDSKLKSLFTSNDLIEKHRYFGHIDLRTGIFSDIIVNNKRTDLVGRLLVEAAILNMLASQIEAHDSEAFETTKRPDLSPSELIRLHDIGDYIRDNISEGMTILNLCKEIGFSSSKLQAGIQFLYGLSVNQYISNIRLGLAKELINATDMSISEICYEVGYSSRSYFSKIFKSRFGVSPKAYKSSQLKANQIFEISYRSMANERIDESEIQKIITTSRNKNSEINITGSLIFHRNVFFQLIEGPKKEVLQLYSKIMKDERHFDIDTLWQGGKISRDFASWDMALLSDSGILNIPLEGDLKKINLNHLMGDMKEQTLASKNLWRKVRNILKTAS